MSQNSISAFTFLPQFHQNLFPLFSYIKLWKRKKKNILRFFQTLKNGIDLIGKNVFATHNQNYDYNKLFMSDLFRLCNKLLILYANLRLVILMLA
jgi:hypothetical protein